MISDIDDPLERSSDAYRHPEETIWQFILATHLTNAFDKHTPFNNRIVFVKFAVRVRFRA